MAQRTRKIRHDENTRRKIQTSQIANRLTAHVLGEVEMTPSQVSAGLGLLRKTLPDLSATALTEDSDGSLKALFKTVYENPDH